MTPSATPCSQGSCGIDYCLSNLVADISSIISNLREGEGEPYARIIKALKDLADELAMLDRWTRAILRYILKGCSKLPLPIALSVLNIPIVKYLDIAPYRGGGARVVIELEALSGSVDTLSKAKGVVLDIVRRAAAAIRECKDAVLSIAAGIEYAGWKRVFTLGVNSCKDADYVESKLNEFKRLTAMLEELLSRQVHGKGKLVEQLRVNFRCSDCSLRSEYISIHARYDPASTRESSEVRIFYGNEVIVDDVRCDARSCECKMKILEKLLKG